MFVMEDEPHSDPHGRAPTSPMHARSVASRELLLVSRHPEQIRESDRRSKTDR